LTKKHPDLGKKIGDYITGSEGLTSVCPPLVVPGGEKVKNRYDLVEEIQNRISQFGICRQSFVVAVGGGAVLDMVGYAASTPHRGIRHIRVPSTVLSQSDSGIGVKNGINKYSKKNFLGSFAPPFAVLNDLSFLESLPDRECRAGLAESVKVSLIKDRDFFDFLEKNSAKLVARDKEVLRETLENCARLHLEHIRTSGDAFEWGQVRPLDFGHWAAHKLEVLSKYEIRHGEAVAAGLALDTIYSHLAGFLTKDDQDRVLSVLGKLGFTIYYREMGEKKLIDGLEEFREHLGGELTITLLDHIGSKFEVHQMDENKIRQAIGILKTLV